VRFSRFARRGYRWVDVRTGNGQWVTTYGDTVEDAMDIALLERREEVPWRRVRRAAVKPGWRPHVGRPVSAAYVWRASGR